MLDNDGRQFKYDTKDAPGTQGAVITYRGSRPSKGKFKFSFWTANQIAAFDANILPLFQIDGTKKTPLPVDVLQVLLASVDIFAVTTEVLKGYEHEGQGLWSFTIDWLEYAPPKKKNVTSTPTNTITTAAQKIGNNISNFFFGNGEKPESQTFPDAQDREIEKLRAKAGQP